LEMGRDDHRGVQGGQTRTMAESLSERGGMERVMGEKGEGRR
jgi:hypothetical protein